MKKHLLSCVLLMVLVVSTAYAEEGTDMINVLQDIPYAEKMMGRRKLVEEDHLLMMQVALRPGQSVPQHDADSNVHLLILKGDLVVNLEGRDIGLEEGGLLPVAFKTPMSIRNDSEKNATFLIMKTPNPGEMK